jgi:hypothetical protein
MRLESASFLLSVPGGLMRILLRAHSTDEYWDRMSHAVVDMGIEEAKSIASRHHAFLKNKKADVDLVEVSYLDDLVTYFDDLEPEKVLPDDKLEAFWEEGWAVLPPDVDLSRFHEARTEGEYLAIHADYFHWQCCPKHGNVEVHTAPLAYAVLHPLL